MHKFIALATIMSTPLFAVESPRVLETTRYQDGLIEIIIQSVEAVVRLMMTLISIVIVIMRCSDRSMM